MAQMSLLGKDKSMLDFLLQDLQFIPRLIALFDHAARTPEAVRPVSCSLSRVVLGLVCFC
jgi:hypothetical protein